MFAQIDWSPILKIYGPLGVGCALAIILVRALLSYIKRQHDEHAKALHEQTVEARAERDYGRQAREREAAAFISTLKDQGELIKEGFDEVLQELRVRDSRRK